jgi:hypothetical protein
LSADPRIAAAAFACLKSAVVAAYPQLAEGRPDLFISLIFSCSANDNALLIRQVLEIRKQCLSMIPRSCLELNSKVMLLMMCSSIVDLNGFSIQVEEFQREQLGQRSQTHQRTRRNH